MTLTNLIAAETIKYRRAWAEPGYRTKCHSLDLWQTRRDLFPETVGSAIDLGCGTGRLVSTWAEAGIDGWGVDLVPAAALDPDVDAARVYAATLWEFRPGRIFDVGVCTDVMEHIPEEQVDETFARIRECCRWVVFTIANFPSRFGNGVDLHATQRGVEWWEHRIQGSMRDGLLERFDLKHTSSQPRYLFRWRSRL